MTRSVWPWRRILAVAAAVAATSAATVVATVSASAANSRPAPTASATAWRQDNSSSEPPAAVPTVTGPIPDPSDISLPLTSYPLSSVGYHESEFFFSGTASAYANTTPMGSDGQWSVAPASTAPYESRVVVVAPNNPAKFSGTVVVEWVNVSAGEDAVPDWEYNHDELVRNGDVYVALDAQAVGINALKTADPARYGDLNSPGDSYSYDIFSQGGMALRALTSTILPGLHPRSIIADGESQSASRMVTYIDAVAPLTHVYDGYFVHSRGASGAALSQAPQPAISVPSPAVTRTDQTVPVMVFETETDVLGAGFDYFPSTQADSKSFRLWEVAGTTHVDSDLLTLAQSDDDSWAWNLQDFSQMFSPQESEDTVGVFTCKVPFNTGEETYAGRTAIHDLARWVQTGVAPKSVPRFEIDTTPAPSYKLDANGNVLGGVRTPAVDTPVAALSGLPAAGSPGFCFLFGQTTPFSTQKLESLYPTHRAFVADWDRSVARDLKAGYLLPQDAAALEDVAAAAN